MTLRYKYSIEDILDTDNVATLVEDDDLRTIGFEVVDNYEADKDTRSEWEERIEDALDLALQTVEVKNTPWPNAANIKYPLLSTAALQFSARAYPALVNGFNVVKGRAIGFDPDGTKTAKAIRISKHMSYQLMEEMPEWEEEMDKLTMVLPILGTVFKKTYYDALLGRNRSELILPQNLIIDYWARNIEDAYRKTHIFTLTENDIYERVASGQYLAVDTRTVQPTDEENKGQSRAGLVAPQGDGPFSMLEQHTFLDLDGDGYEEPYIITVVEDTGEVVKITKRFDDNQISWLGDKRDVIVKITPTEYFTKFGFIPSPDGGFYDIGFGTLLGPINETINSTTNMLLDSGTLANMQAGFISKGLRIAGGNQAFIPGEWKQAQTVSGKLSDHVMPLPISQPSNVLFQLLSTMIQAGERLSSVTDIMTGDVPGQNTKATVALQALEQGMKVFNAIYKRIHRSLKQEFKKIYELNARYLPPIGYFNILGSSQAAPIGKGDYQLGDVSVIPYSDPNVATEAQRLGKLELLMPLLQMGTIDPMEFTLRYVDATEQPAPEKLLAKQRGPSMEEQLKAAEQRLKEQQAMWTAQQASAKLAIEQMLANSTIEKNELDSIVKFMELSMTPEQAKAMTEGSEKEEKDETKD